VVKITLGTIEERILESSLRRFVDALPGSIVTFAVDDQAQSNIRLLEDAAAMAPSLAGDVLALRAVVRRALSEGCPAAGKRCAWCGADLTLAIELHHRICPWLAIVNVSSRLDGIPTSSEHR
jgi:hypothetical protein